MYKMDRSSSFQKISVEYPMDLLSSVTEWRLINRGKEEFKDFIYERCPRGYSN